MASYKCDIARAAISEEGIVSVQIKALNPPAFDYTWFQYQGPNSKEVLAIALAALTADLAVGVDLDSTQEHSPFKVIHAGKRVTIDW